MRKKLVIVQAWLPLMTASLLNSVCALQHRHSIAKKITGQSYIPLALEWRVPPNELQREPPGVAQNDDLVARRRMDKLPGCCSTGYKELCKGSFDVLNCKVKARCRVKGLMAA